MNQFNLDWVWRWLLGNTYTPGAYQVPTSVQPTIDVRERDQRVIQQFVLTQALGAGTNTFSPAGGTFAVPQFGPLTGRKRVWTNLTFVLDASLRINLSWRTPNAAAPAFTVAEYQAGSYVPTTGNTPLIGGQHVISDAAGLFIMVPAGPPVLVANPSVLVASIFGAAGTETVTFAGLFYDLDLNEPILLDGSRP